MSQGLRRALLILGLGIVLLAVAGLIYQAMSVAADRRNHPPAGELIDMGGYELHLHCEGEGSPTVLLIAGAGDIAQIWQPVQEEIRQGTRVCSYDRPGLGWSDYVPDGELTLERQMQIFYNALQTAGEGGPYVVVGHSIGGVMARSFATLYPEETVGVVLVDSSVEGQFSALPAQIAQSNQSADAVFTVCNIAAPFGVHRLLGLGTARAEAQPTLSEDARTAIANTFHQTRGCAALQRDGAIADHVLNAGEPLEAGALGDTPLVVLTAGLATHEENPNADYSEAQVALFSETQEIWLELQEGLTALSSESTWTIAEQSGHYIHTSQPDLVISAVQGVLAAQ